jgi:HB1/ASXL restriction endonuclease-like protein with HTH domain
MGVLDAVAAVLAEAGTPLRAGDITRRVLDTGRWQTQGKTPSDTIRAEMAMDIKERGLASRFQRAGRGQYALRAWRLPEYAGDDGEQNGASEAATREQGEQQQELHLMPVAHTNTPSPAAPASPAASSVPPSLRALLPVRGSGRVPTPAHTPATTLSFTDAAEHVLDRFGGRRPMHYRDITNKALELGLLKTSGRTPEASLYAQILTEMARQTQRGEMPRFAKLGRGLIALTRWELRNVISHSRPDGDKGDGRLAADLRIAYERDLHSLERYWHDVFYGPDLDSVQFERFHRLAYEPLPSWVHRRYDSQLAARVLELGPSVVEHIHTLSERLALLDLYRGRMREHFETDEAKRLWREYTEWKRARTQGNTEERIQAQSEAPALSKRENDFCFPLIERWNECAALVNLVRESGNPMPHEEGATPAPIGPDKESRQMEGFSSDTFFANVLDFLRDGGDEDAAFVLQLCERAANHFEEMVDTRWGIGPHHTVFITLACNRLAYDILNNQGHPITRAIAHAIAANLSDDESEYHLSLRLARLALTVEEMARLGRLRDQGNPDKQNNPGPDVFIVYGHDDGARFEVAHHLEAELRIRAIMLDQHQPRTGTTLI